MAGVEIDDALEDIAPDQYRDAEAYPVVFYSDNGTSHTLFDIVDARQWMGRAGVENKAPVLDQIQVDGDTVTKVIPITIDGITFNNSSKRSQNFWKDFSCQTCRNIQNWRDKSTNLIHFRKIGTEPQQKMIIC